MLRTVLLLLLSLLTGAAGAAVNINTATAKELESLNGIGPIKARNIIAYREKHGPYVALEDVMKAEGIGSSFEDIKNDITLEGKSSIAGQAEEAETAPVAPDSLLPDGRIWLLCTYYEIKTSEPKAISIEDATIVSVADPAFLAAAEEGLDNAAPFARSATMQKRLYIAQVGQPAQCVYPSGNSVRVKVGANSPRFGGGHCAAETSAYLSLWVNGRTVESMSNFEGPCIEPRSLTYTVSRGRVTKCVGTYFDKEGELLANPPPKSCVNFPGIERYPLDVIEYPPKGKTVLPAGAMKLLQGKHAVCDVAREELGRKESRENAFKSLAPVSASVAPRPVIAELGIGASAVDVERAEAQAAKDPVDDYERALPAELAHSNTAFFDFDNDGKVDLVFTRSSDFGYVGVSRLLVQEGKSAKWLKFSASAKPEKAWYLPCQADGKRRRFSQCASRLEQHDLDKLSGLSFPGSGKARAILFAELRSMLIPFRFNGRTYLAVLGSGFDDLHLAAIFEPLPGRRIRPVCLLEKVQENF